MKRVLLSAVVAGSLAVAHQAAAEEDWVPHLPGANEGMAMGSLPPPGFYFTNDTLVTSAPYHNDSGHKAGGVRVDGWVDVPALLWAPNLTLLGAQYAALLVQPFDRTDTMVGAMGNNAGFGRTGIFDTIVSPLNLSWALPSHVHVATGLSFYLPDGSFTTKNKFAGAPNSIGYWVIEPRFAVSYLDQGWNLTANIVYDKNFKNHKTHYLSGDVIDVDYTATKQIGKWEAGIGGYAAYQVADDKQNGVTVPAVSGYSGRGNRTEKYAIGPIVGYNFGPVALQARYNHPIHAANTVQGDEFWTRISIPF